MSYGTREVFDHGLRAKFLVLGCPGCKQNYVAKDLQTVNEAFVKGLRAGRYPDDFVTCMHACACATTGSMCHRVI